ncbi:hypothetical protein ElyMa_001645900 [Elysia marginata]|uniref:Integrase zinc-binding domain-containing protein n=1 Tax=Elysia marginata TaxID=1093978 RepID=A0AAV4JSX7_9GAST|nr:hypothetical protein ElyMa_001645900 [Elysia marginata]
MRKEILDRIHDGHPGITKSRQRVKQAVWWPRISKDIQRMVAECRHCLEIRPIQPSEPLIPTELPHHPFQKVAIDIVLKICGVDHEDLQSRHTAAKVSQKRHFDKHTHPLPSPHKGYPSPYQDRWEKGWKQSGTILEQCEPRSYKIRTPRGDIRRNRKHVMLCLNHHHPADEPLPNTVLDEQLLEFSAIPEPQFEASQNLQNEAGPPTSPGPKRPSSTSSTIRGAQDKTPLSYVTRSGRAVNKLPRFCK